MGGLYQQSQRVEAGVLALGAGAEVAEGEVAAWIQRIPEGPHLGQHHGGPHCGDVIQHGGNVPGEGVGTGKIHLLPIPDS